MDRKTKHRPRALAAQAAAAVAAAAVVAVALTALPEPAPEPPAPTTPEVAPAPPPVETEPPPAPPQEPPPEQPESAPGHAVTPELWQGAGILVNRAEDFPAEQAAVMREHGFRWVALFLHHGLARADYNDAPLATGWVEAFEAQGLVVCGWGWLDADPLAEVELIAELISRHGFDCYIADAENPYMGEGYGGDVGRSAQFVEAFRGRFPTLTAAVTTYGGAVHPWVLPFDYASWRDAGFALLPQTYLAVAGGVGPRAAVEHAVRAGYPADRVHPMIGVGWGQDREGLSAEHYVWRLEKARTRGFSVFLGETMTGGDFAVLAEGIRAGTIAG